MKTTIYAIAEERKSKNQGFGFFGTMIVNYGTNYVQTERLFDEAISILQDRLSLEATVARRLLDSRWGRHCADQVAIVQKDLREYVDRCQRTRSGRADLQAYINCAKQEDEEYYA